MTVVRREIGRRLSLYYAQSADRVIGSTPNPISMNNLWGEWHWKRVFQKLYNQQKGQWLTPVELFKPFYSNTMANFVARCFEEVDGGPLEVVEMGGGRGTNASLILSHLMATQPDIYERISYKILDSSPTLHQLQRKTLDATGHIDMVSWENVDLLDVAEGKAKFMETSSTPTVVLALELLDNLPHDKIRVRKGLVEQAVVAESGNGLVEHFEPLSDKLLGNILLQGRIYKQGKPGWVPTVACELIRRIAQDRPRASFLLADFDWLPPPDKFEVTEERLSTWADGEPLVTSMEDVDYECYLRAPVLSDILFPTDFAKLSRFVKGVWKDERAIITVSKQADFLDEFGPEQVAMTKSWLTGYSPLLHDFGNCSILTAMPERGKVD